MKTRDIKKCALCGNGVGASGAVDFFVVSVTRHFFHHDAIKRAAGLEMMLGGGQDGAVLASVLGTDEDISIPVVQAIDQWVCARCVYQEPKGGTQLWDTLEAGAEDVDRG